jgi:hypothetical protein
MLVEFLKSQTKNVRNVVLNFGIYNWSIFVAALIIYSARRQNAIGQPYLYGEDGVVWLRDLYFSGNSLFKPAQGAFYELQRFVAFILSPLSIQVTPRAYYFASVIIVVSGFAIILQKRFSKVFGSLAIQRIGFLLLVTMPGTWEVHGSITNMGWLLVASSALILIAPNPETKKGKILEIAWLTLLGLTGFGCLYLAPLAAWALIKNIKNKYVLSRFMVIFISSSIQVFQLYVSGRKPNGELPLILYFAAYLKKVAGVFLIGHNNFMTLWPPTESRKIYWGIATIFTTLVLFLVYKNLKGPTPWLLFAGIISISLSLYAEKGLAVVFMPLLWGDRYYVPALGLTILIVSLSLNHKEKIVRKVAVVILFLSIFGIASDFSIKPMKPLDANELSIFSECVSNKLPSCELNVAPEGFKIKIP